MSTVLHVVESRAPDGTMRRDDMLPDETGERLAFTQLMSAVQRPEMIGLEADAEAAEPSSFLGRLTAAGSSLRMPSGRPYALTSEHAALVASMLPRGGRARRTTRRG